ncbi:hypothetical protein PV11_00554 [Exophiala sideris]|uniref:Ribosomal protein S21 n=1 Tax=Exophiala sideris TaxID=1016849 RepID=A0A0D1YPR6_9EURO|nr:hypothetical protein PV11_00554 [Exophiala sideris]
MNPISSLQTSARLALSKSSPQTVLLSSSTKCLHHSTRLVARHATSKRPFSSSRTARNPPPPETPPKREGPASKISDLVRQLRPTKDTPRSDQSVSDSMDALMGKTPRSRTTGAFEDLMGPRASSRMVDRFSEEVRAPSSSIALRLRPTLGRTVGGVYRDVGGAFRQLERKCANNRIKKDARDQLFHVRKGQAKKDIGRWRWRQLFRDGFVAECDRIRRMRKQGW